MKFKKSVTVSLDAQELEILEKLNKKLNQRSMKEPNRTETLKFAIRFTQENFDTLNLVEELRLELKKVMEENNFFKQSFREFEDKVKKKIDSLNC
ncbi:hypothetical protein [Bacillus altitudinis]|uniref:hypothetical protein n=1 Tax=Bacillus altitudinis TaxID=293387 RepID=UPI002101708B|nr:hypothetical protein [Bacillus altitudinis]UTV31697.1 hypothetical protein NM966_12925 [Bacillus altitudinis]